MTTWNYRILHKRQMVPHTGEASSFSIIEVYYDEDNRIVNWSDTMEPYGDTPDELRADLSLMLKAFDHSIIDEKELKTP